MIDQPDQDPATWKVMGTGRVSAFPPDGFFSRQWRSGDTLFTESSANPAALMLRYLQQSAVVRAFIEGRGR